MNRSLTLCCLALLAACQEGPYGGTADGRAANGVYRGVVSDQIAHESVQAHVLDGLMLGFGLDNARRYSGEYSSGGGQMNGYFDRRDGVGEIDKTYRLQADVLPHDRIEASLDGPRDSAEMSLFYSARESESGADEYELSGIYVMDENGIGLTLSIDPYGVIEGYDAAGCAYFGRAQLADPGHSLFEVALDIDNCALGSNSRTGSEFAFGIAALEFAGTRVTLVLPAWLDHADRVENWILERR